MVAFQMFGFNGIWRGNYFGGEPLRRTEDEVRVGNFKNGKAADKDDITGVDKKWWTGFGGCVIGL